MSEQNNSQDTQKMILQWERWLLATLATVSIYGAIWANNITTVQAEQNVKLDNIGSTRTQTVEELEQFDARQREILKKVSEMDRQQGELTVSNKALSEDVREVKSLVQEIARELRNR